MKHTTPSFVDRLDRRAEAHNSGIDFLRIWSMALVVLQHMLLGSWGGALGTAQSGSVPYYLCTLARVLTCCAVDTFALISGYVAYSEKQKPIRVSGYLQLWMQVVTCGLFAALVFRIADPASVSLKEFVLPFFPVTASLYWYFTAYSGLFILTPFLNSAIRNMPKQTLRLLLPVLFAAFSVFETATDRFKLESGFSMVWLLILYCMGGILKKCDVGKHLKPWAAFLCITALTGITWAWYILNMEFSLFGITLGNESLMSYTSPTSVGAAMLYVIAFSKLRFRKHFSRFIALISPCAFSVYLLNTNELVRTHFINGRFAFLGTAAPHVIVATLLVFPIVFVAACVVIDRVRIFLFDLLHVKQLTDAIERRIRDVAIVFSR